MFVAQQHQDLLCKPCSCVMMLLDSRVGRSQFGTCLYTTIDELLESNPPCPQFLLGRKDRGFGGTARRNF